MIKKLQDILSGFLGNPKNDITSSGQLEYSCPHCREIYGSSEDRKYNLSISLQKQKFQCWKCAASDEDMHGSVIKLIKMYGNNEILNDYKNTINEFRNSKLYELHYSKDDFNIDFTNVIKEELKLPANFRKIREGAYIPKKVSQYLKKRNIGFDIINDFQIGYTTFDENNKQLSSRIIIPSFDSFGELNYWTGRDYTSFPNRQKYFNPKVERKDIIFDEDKVMWDADITLVEGPFDHIVVPNSIPLLGKVLKQDFKIFQMLMTKANANVNIFLDADAYEDVKKIYSLLNHDRLYGKVRYIPVEGDLDPSEIYEKFGKKGIIQHLRGAKKMDEKVLM